MTEGQSCNCTLFSENGKQYLISRVPSYTLCENYYSYWPDNVLNTVNQIYEVDDSFNLTYIKDLNNPYFTPGCRFNGLEDFRVINWNGINHFTCTKICSDEYTTVVCFGIIKDAEIVYSKEVPTSNKVEKNWMMIESEPFNCIYSIKPYKKINLVNHRFTDLTYTWSRSYSGSSPLLRYSDDYLISLVHFKKEPKKYIHQLVLYDNTLIPVRRSQPFTFLGCSVEFCSCLKVTDDGIILLPAVYDGISYKFNIPSEVLMRLFDWALTDNTVDAKLNNRLYLDAKLIGANEVATTIACTVDDVSYIRDAILYNHMVSTEGPNRKCMRCRLLSDRFKQLKSKHD